jgi:PEP-CTERM motif
MRSLTKPTACGAWGLVALLAAALPAPAGQVVTFPKTTGDMVFDGRPIPGVGTPHLLFGLQPADPSAAYGGASVSLADGRTRPAFDTGNAGGQQVLHFAASLDDNPLPIDRDSWHVTGPKPGDPESLTASFNVGLGPTLFNVALDLHATGGVQLLPQYTGYPVVLPGFPLAYEVWFKPAGGADPAASVQVAFQGQPLTWSAPGGTPSAPEPSTLCLLSLGALALAGYGCRRPKRLRAR